MLGRLALHKGEPLLRKVRVPVAPVGRPVADRNAAVPYSAEALFAVTCTACSMLMVCEAVNAWASVEAKTLETVAVPALPVTVNGNDSIGRFVPDWSGLVPLTAYWQVSTWPEMVQFQPVPGAVAALGCVSGGKVVVASMSCDSEPPPVVTVGVSV